MPGIGKLLKEARISKNISLSDAENITKIRYYYLQALEDEEYAKLPGKVYAIGFLRRYADFLGLDPEVLIEDLKKEIDFPDENVVVKAEKINEKKSLGFKRYLLAIIAIATLMFIYFFYNNSGDNNTLVDENNATIIQELKHNQNEINIQKDNESEKALTTHQYEGANLRIVVVGDKCWIRVIADENLIFEGTLYYGQEKEFRGEKEIKIRLGNPQAVKVIFNGEEYKYEGLSRPLNEVFNI